MNFGTTFNFDSFGAGFETITLPQPGTGSYAEYTTAGSNTHHNHPALEGYNPAAMVQGRTYTTVQVDHNGNSNNNSNNPTNSLANLGDLSAAHHNLLLSVGGYVTAHDENAMVALLGSLQQQHHHHQQQLEQHHQQQQQQQHKLHASHLTPASFLTFDTVDDPLPYHTDSSGQPTHQRQSSLEDLLLMSPSLFAAANFDQLPSTECSTESSTNSLAGLALSSEKGDRWLDELSLSVPSLSVEPLSGSEVVQRLRDRMDDVQTRYIPCVDFLVQCQQDLRKGLMAAQQQQRSYSGRRYAQSSMTPRQFYNTYIESLPQKFYLTNRYTMEEAALNEAYEGLQKLRTDSQNCIQQGSEIVKNAFLGGMKDGESWGLRKWLSQHGNALRACTDMECILNACQKLDRSSESTRKLAEILRPLAKQTLDRLKKEIPQSYQEQSTAHPYLPFFHRLEAALRGMSNFDPEDDDVICIDDDDEIEQMKAQPKPPPKETAKPADVKRKRVSDSTREVPTAPPNGLHQVLLQLDEGDQAVATKTNDDNSSSGDSDIESVVEVVDAKQPLDAPGIDGTVKWSGEDWKCPLCAMENAGDQTTCQACGESMQHLSFLPLAMEALVNMNSANPGNIDSDNDSVSEPSKKRRRSSKSKDDSNHAGTLSPGNSVMALLPERVSAIRTAALNMAASLEQVAELFDSNQQSIFRPFETPLGTFWDGGRYAHALRLLCSLLRLPEAPPFVDRVDEDQLIIAGNPPYSHVIKHPLCFRDIVASLIRSDDDSSDSAEAGDGRLPVRGLSSWNMWKGMDFLQAIDLVFLNSLAYGKAIDEGKSQHRALTNRLRKTLWNGINQIVTEHVDDANRRKQYMPTRRSESSGFVVYKIQER